MKISVLMTVYNGGIYLKPAIESVLAQTFKDFEFLIINDASNDNSKEIISSFNDPRIKVVTNPQNLGQTASLNEGLRRAHGDFIARIDADDKVYPVWLECQLNSLKDFPDAVVVSPRSVLIDSRDNLIKELNTPRSSSDIIFKSIFASPINHVGSLMRRDTICEAGGYDEHYKIVADFALWSLLIRQGQLIVSSPHVLVAVRSHANSISAQEADKRVILEMVDVMGRNIAFWSLLKVRQEEVMLLWRLVYAGHRLGEKELLAALQLFEQVYCHWNRKETSKNDEAIVFWRQQEKTLILKRIWFLMKQKDYLLMRQTASLYIKERGKVCILIMIWLLTYLPMGLTLILVFYDSLMIFKANRKIA